MFTLCLMENFFFYVSIEKITPKELSADTSFISQCQHYLEKYRRMLPMFAKIGKWKTNTCSSNSHQNCEKRHEIENKNSRRGRSPFIRFGVDAINNFGYTQPSQDMVYI